MEAAGDLDPNNPHIRITNQQMTTNNGNVANEKEEGGS